MGQGTSSTVVAWWEFTAPAAPACEREARLPNAHLRWEDGGRSSTIESSPQPRQDTGFFLRLMSWADQAERGDTSKHPTLAQLLGKRVRVTVEVIE